MRNVNRRLSQGLKKLGIEELQIRKAHRLADQLLLTRHNSIALQRRIRREGPSTERRLATGGRGATSRACSPLYSAGASLDFERHVSQRSESVVRPEPEAAPCF